MWGLSSPTRDQTCIPRIGRWILITGPWGKSLYLTSWGIAKLFSAVAALFFTPTINALEFPFLHIVADAYFLFLFLKPSNECEMVSHVVLICIPWWLMMCIFSCGFDLHSMMTNDVHLFMWWLAICIASLKKCQFKLFTQFLKCVDCFFVIKL